MNSSTGLSAATAIQRWRHSDDLTITYLGQVGFLLQKNGLAIAIDPYLSDSVDRLEGCPRDFWVRNYPPPVDPRELTGIDLVLCTHEHLDHTDPETLCAISAASPHCRFAGPAVSIAAMRNAGIEAKRLMVLDEGTPLAFNEVVIEPLAAAHESYETDGEGHHKYLSYLIRWNGLTLFHAGDTVVTPQLRERLSHETVDVGFLPINGRSTERHEQGVVGNMNAEEAAIFSSALNFDLVIPTHYDLYPNNGAPLADFARAWESRPLDRRPKLKAFLPGEKIVYGKADRPRELAVMLGAGKTGRGFLARLLAHSAYDLVSSTVPKSWCVS